MSRPVRRPPMGSNKKGIMNATIVVVVEGQAFRFQCKMLLDDEEAFQKALVNKLPENIEIEVKSMWCIVGTKAGGVIYIKGKENYETK